MTHALSSGTLPTATPLHRNTAALPLDYDPVKDRLGDLAEKSPALTKGFYRTLDLVFLRAWYVHRRLRALIARLPQDRPINVLDAGTGFGQYAYFLLREFPQVRVHAVDIKDDYLDRAERFFKQTPYADRVSFGWRDLTAPQPETDAYDLILSVDVMEHIEDDRGVFRNFRQMLRPGGYVLVNTPSDLGGSGITEEGQESFIGEHVRDGYNVGELYEKLDTAGLTPVLHEYTYGRYGSAAWRLLVKWPIQALNASWLTAPLVGAYYLGALPAGLALNRADLQTPNAEGTGLLVVAQKSA
ncbi:MAG: class I SAM-dependent methyltransferase [Bacteroidota bacterium]